MNSLKETQRNSNHQLFEVLDTLSENVKNMKLEIKKLSDETKENRRLLGAIADQNSIYMDDDDSESVLWLLFAFTKSKIQIFNQLIWTKYNPINLSLWHDVTLELEACQKIIWNAASWFLILSGKMSRTWSWKLKSSIITIRFHQKQNTII